jgi:hypothetical protein
LKAIWASSESTDSVEVAYSKESRPAGMLQPFHLPV